MTLLLDLKRSDIVHFFFIIKERGKMMSETNIDTLTLRVKQDSDQAVGSLRQLSTELTTLKTAVTGLSASAKELNSFSNAIGKLNTNVNSFSVSASQIGKIGTQLKELNTLSTSASSLKTMGKDLGSVGRGLKAFSSNVKNFEVSSSGVKKITTQINLLGKSAGSVNGLSLALKGVNAELKRIQKTNSSSSLTKKTGMLGSLQSINSTLNFGKLLYVGRILGNVFGSSITAANNYIESTNLFKVAMGEYSDEAERWSDEVSGALGIDPAQMRKNMGLFMQLSTAMGTSAKQSYVLSKNMSQLAYDISSFYNIKIEDSFLKLQSAMVGELEPIRRLGIDISAARLQQELYTLGIHENINAISQSDKAILRYIAIMKQTTNAQADMGKTLMSPANALRVLQSSFIKLSRAIGYIFIPLLQSMLPIIQLVVDALTWLGERLAALLGFEMPEFDNSGMTASIGGIEEVGDTADAAAKKLKGFTSGLDELNVIDVDTPSGVGDLQVGNLLGDIELPEYDMLSKYAGNLTNEVLPKLKKALEAIGESPIIKVAVEVLKSFYDGIKKLSEWALNNPEQLAEAITLIGSALLIYGGIKMAAGVITWFHNLAGMVELVKNGLLAIKTIEFSKLIGSLSKFAGAVLIVYGAIKAVSLIMDIMKQQGNITAKQIGEAFKALGTIITGVALISGSITIGVFGAVALAFGVFWDDIALMTAKGYKALTDNIGTFIYDVWYYATITINKITTGWNVFFTTIEVWFHNFAVAGKTAWLTLKKGFIEVMYDMLNNKSFKALIDAFNQLTGNKFNIDFGTGLKNEISKIQWQIDNMVVRNADAEIQKIVAASKAAQDEAKAFRDSQTNRIEGTTQYIVDYWQKNKSDNIAAKEMSKLEQQATQWKEAGQVPMPTVDTKSLDEQTRLAEEQAKMVKEQTTQLNAGNELATTGNNIAQATNTGIGGVSTGVNNLTNETYKAQEQTATSLYDIGVKISNIWWKLDRVETACKNIRINVTNNTYNSYGSSGGSSKSPKPEIFGYATGGYVSGEMFLANESGPELIGNIGSKSAVANTTQMVEALTNGVYQGVISALSTAQSQKTQTNVNVVLPNGRVLAQAVADGNIDNGYSMGLGGFNV